jgi:hypothetical protein
MVRGMSVAPVNSAMGETNRPDRRPWYGFADWRYLGTWLAVTAAGVIGALVPAFPAQDVLASSVVGAGIAGLLSEVTFWFDRRDATFQFQVEQNQLANLEGQVSRVDRIAQKTAIIAVNQLFQLGIEAAQCRFADDEELGKFSAETEEIAGILGVAGPVRAFLGSPWMRAKDGPAPDGEDPFPNVVSSCRLRYTREGVEALKGGYTVGVAMRRPGEFVTSKEYRDSSAEILRESVKLLFLLPHTVRNLLRAIDDLERGSCDPRHFIGYLTLFSFYLTYRRTGQFPDVAPLFESPLSLADKAAVWDVARALATLSDQSADVPEPEMPDTRDGQGRPAEQGTEPGGTPSGEAATGGASVTASPFGSIRTSFVVFWLIVTGAGLAVGLSGLSFPAKALICPAVVGAGIAGLLSEFIYCFERRADAVRVAAKHKQYLELAGHIRGVDGLMRRDDIARINQACRFGYQLCAARFGPDGTVQSALALAAELAEILRVPAAFTDFAEEPNLREKVMPAGAQEPVSKVKYALQLRYSRDVLAAFDAGTTIGAVVNNMAALADAGIQAQVVERLENVATLLELPAQVDENVRRSSRELREGRCEPRNYALYLFLFPVYLTYRMTGQHEAVQPLFESPTSLSGPETPARLLGIVSRMAGKEAAPA